MSKDNIWLKAMEIGNKAGCHQKPERSFFLSGYQFPVCARCTGILIGYLLAVFAYFFVKMPWYFCIILCLPLCVDGITQYIKIRESNNMLRVFTGIFSGFGLMNLWIRLILRIIRGIHKI